MHLFPLNVNNVNDRLYDGRNVTNSTWLISFNVSILKSAEVTEHFPSKASIPVFNIVVCSTADCLHSIASALVLYNQCPSHSKAIIIEFFMFISRRVQFKVSGFFPIYMAISHGASDHITCLACFG